MPSTASLPRGMALSIRQPWATLIVHGLKTIEIRRWSSRYSGLVYIHAGLIADKREQAWDLVPEHLVQATELRGGIVGRALMTGCREYLDAKTFARDTTSHHNATEWFTPPKMFGFVLSSAEPLDFWPQKGELHFFRISLPRRRRPGARKMSRRK